MNGGGYIRGGQEPMGTWGGLLPDQEKRFETIYVSADQNIFWIYW